MNFFLISWYEELTIVIWEVEMKIPLIDKNSDKELMSEDVVVWNILKYFLKDWKCW